ncbi:leucine rich repeats and immunoglobulin [Trichuris trichiura]|uniref:Leucine rich repeats and immunoglobulin n=1 Tax=Trichuris trichiura TaxID=36087 RepID=A0A077Z4Q2_TRITR|nr:leucine rich repeats and immunoglobulin [Trichuris trichiura]
MLNFSYADFNVIAVVQKECFENFTSLQELSLVKNKLRKVSKEAFVPLSRLESLDLSRNRLRRIDWFSFKGLNNLRFLRLERNGLAVIHDGAFGTLNQLLELYLNNNRLISVGRGWLYGLERLNKLVLSNNAIENVDSEGWRFCMRLTTLDLSKNAIRSIDSKTFSYLERLQNLDLSSNSISQMHQKALSVLPNLKYLDLSHNKLSEVFMSGQHVFQGLSALKVLKLNGNQLRSLPANVFQGLSRLDHLQLLDNPIVVFSEDAISSIGIPSILLINSTKLLCNCKSKWLVVFVQQLDPTSPSASTTCAYPTSLNGKMLTQLSIDLLTCDDFWPRPIIVDQPKPVTAVEGDTVAFNCSAQCADCSLLFYWSRNDVRLYPFRNNGLTTSVQRNATGSWTASLMVEAVDETDAGLYRCHAINELTVSLSDKVPLSVQVPPYFVKKPANVAVTVGGTLRMECAAAGSPTPSISWQKDGGENFPAAKERRMHVMPTDDVFVIVPVKETDSGLYACIAESTAGLTKVEVEVVVLGNGNILTRNIKAPTSMSDKTVSSGEMAVLECGHDGSAEWFHNGKPLRSGQRIFITRQGQMLVIIDANARDQGVYACRYKGGSTSARLVVRDSQDANSKKKSGSTKNTNDAPVSPNRPNIQRTKFDLVGATGLVLVVIVLCIITTSSVSLCIVQRCRREPSLLVSFRQDPLEIAAVTGVTI